MNDPSARRRLHSDERVNGWKKRLLHQLHGAFAAPFDSAQDDKRGSSAQRDTVMANA